METLRNFRTTGDPEKYGTVKIFKAPKDDKMDFLSGVYMGDGRKIGDGKNESETFIIVEVGGQTVGDPVNLLPKHQVLKNEIEKILKVVKAEKRENEKIYLSIAYKGQTVSSNGAKYHNYFIKWDYADPMEAQEAEELLAEAKGEFRK